MSPCRSWKFYLMAVEMVGFLTRSDIPFPANAVELFTKNLLHDSVKVRKVRTNKIFHHPSFRGRQPATAVFFNIKLECGEGGDGVK